MSGVLHLAATKHVCLCKISACCQGHSFPKQVGSYVIR